ncbi:hypothetical protein C8Q75DRAFT_310687 [Abortiporus biennis]|nr:hypothetical protein C8Q75DRAFT_310687 [Abortiporus biennis]
MAPTQTQYDQQRAALKKIADDTLEAIDHGSYLHHDLTTYISASKHNTRYYAPDSLLSTWRNDSNHPRTHANRVALLEMSTLEGARWLANQHAGHTHPKPKIGILNFASAKSPGGGFLRGAQAQEESIARSSTLYPTLLTRVAQEFYTLHNRDQKGGYYTHAMIYSPGIVIFRDDNGGWVEPLQVDVLTSAAVNAGVVRGTIFGKVAGDSIESKIEKVMKERMARLLYLFEMQGVKDIVLGSFGTGVFRNDVATIANIWAELLFAHHGRFNGSFDNVVFAIIGKGTFEKFHEAFKPYIHHPPGDIVGTVAK